MAASSPNKLKQQTTNAYNWLAKKYTQEWGNHIDTELANRFINMLPSGASILDIGCGPGQYTRYFQKNKLHAIGIDLAQNMIFEAKQADINICYSQMDMWQLGFADKTFDGLWLCASFPHVPEEETPVVLKELRRVIKDDGIFFIGIVVNDELIRIESQKEMGLYNQEGRFFQHYKNKEYFKNLLIRNGFNVVDSMTHTIVSNVLSNTSHKINSWVNFFCTIS